MADEKSDPNVSVNKFWPIVALSGSVASLFVGYQVGLVKARPSEHFPVNMPLQTTFDTVLDGDTIVISGEAIKVRGIDAPELGPWAKCWGEALAAGFSKSQLEEELLNRKYRISEKRKDKAGVLSAKFIDQEGFDLTDPMTVNGGAALTEGKWDWCRSPPKPGKENEKAPHGPNLWWPGGDVYDARAAD